MQITDEQLEALQLAHDAVRATWADYKPYRGFEGFQFPIDHLPPDWDKRTDDEEIAICDALDTLTAAIEALKEGK